MTDQLTMGRRRIAFILLAALLSVPSFGIGASKADAKKIKKITASDVVLFYAGGELGNYYDQKYAADYVSYVDRDGEEHWLFDGFLLLQIWDTKAENASEVTFTPGMKDGNGNWLPSANQADWKKLVDYYFSEGRHRQGCGRGCETPRKACGKETDNHLDSGSDALPSADDKERRNYLLGPH